MPTTVSLEHAVNLSSLRIVREELDVTVQRAAGEFEAYLADPANHGALSQCRQDLAQLGGTLRLIQFPGAALLADEMAINARILEQRLAEAVDMRPRETELDALGHGLVVLPRYLDFVDRRQAALPILVLPWVNQLRAARRAPFVAEHHFEAWRPAALGDLEWPQRPAGTGAIKRLRSMFQAGLLAAIRQGAGNGGPAVGFASGHPGELMARAARRVSELFPATAGGGVLPLLACVTEALAAGQLQLNLNRRRSLAAAEQLFGKLQRQDRAALEDPAVAALREDLLFLLALIPSSGADEPQAAGVSDGSSQLRMRLCRAFGLEPLTPSDPELSAHREAMQGPATDTIQSVVVALRDELRSAKEILEIGAQNQGLLDQDLLPLTQTLERIADTLVMLKLNAPAQALRQQLPTVHRWQGRSGQVELMEFHQLADALLFVESCLSALVRHQLEPSELQVFDPVQRDRIIAASHLAEAEAIVINEAQAGINMTKRAVAAYVEAGFDRTHIANVATTLGTVRGGLATLGYSRAAAVVRSCVDFVEHHQNERQRVGTQTQHLLETLADALISLEYYLGELEASGGADENILAIAEESLAALGFAVPANG